MASRRAVTTNAIRMLTPHASSLSHCQNMDGRNGNDGRQQLSLKFPEVDMTHPGWLVLVIREMEARDEVLVTGEHDHYQQTRDQGEIDQR
jgi:hypothetical protein